MFGGFVKRHEKNGNVALLPAISVLIIIVAIVFLFSIYLILPLLKREVFSSWVVQHYNNGAGHSFFIHSLFIPVVA